MNHFTVMKKMISQLEDFLENIEIYDDDYMIGIRRDDLSLELAYDYQWSDETYFGDALGHIEGLRDEIRVIIMTLGDFFKSEDFYDHEIFGDSQ